MGLKLFNSITRLFDKRGKSDEAEYKFANVEEMRVEMPDLLYGYLSDGEMPNSLVLLAPPPEPASAVFEFDLEYARRVSKSKDQIRFLQAVSDANLSFPHAVRSFEATLGIDINEVLTPKLYSLMRRVMTDARLSTYTAKNFYNRERPFVVNKQKTCTPELEEVLRKVGCFPSGHAAVGWAWALVFSEIFPDKEKVILERGLDFGESRLICNVHWHSDVVKGREMGKATVDCLRVNTAFNTDLLQVKEEVFQVLKSMKTNG
ncbi:acid phosphatase [Flavobacterium lipolyticum]|uniref:Acid phosphatase n=1 Tax=Flavobacterium lipolyticum TaxID=2893754 RepID=A0ABS8M0T6_9FLAO|nr:phosphatase PAP2 family protein [Flavobacterium sp. F-126]MCC9018399.1 phosphatase PAP2 family protein [Flavobacterium sp. F-126]